MLGILDLEPTINYCTLMTINRVEGLCGLRPLRGKGTRRRELQLLLASKAYPQKSCIHWKARRKEILG